MRELKIEEEPEAGSAVLLFCCKADVEGREIQKRGASSGKKEALGAIAVSIYGAKGGRGANAHAGPVRNFLKYILL